ncbi:MAG TPA: SDR family oxidoreductase [Thermoanaerobaculia bacterium]|nr:SDR family oxidoreductase [Thermoanaerobaculia bacterium]
MSDSKGRGWALVLGASSGFGEACSRALAAAGWNVFGVHLDRKATMPHVDEIVAAIRAEGVRAEFYNINAADEGKRGEVVAEIRKVLAETEKGSRITVLLHSLAFGTLKPFFGESREASMAKPQMEMTLDVMAHSLVYWTQDLYFHDLFGETAKIFAMTSAGDHIVWPAYGAVSAAKCALESHVRQIAVELATKNISANAIRAGVTDTPALRKIPGNEAMIERVLGIHPAKRLTTPRDVAAALVALCVGETRWISGNVIGVDGGEDIAGGS